jgi:hypothetical protein
MNSKFHYLVLLIRKISVADTDAGFPESISGSGSRFYNQTLNNFCKFNKSFSPNVVLQTSSEGLSSSRRSLPFRVNI